MAEEDSQEDSEKTEEPTPYRIEQAFKQGQTYYSREVTTFLMLVILTLTIAWLGPYIMKKSLFLRFYIENSYDLEITEKNLGTLIKSLFTKSLLLIIIPLGLTLLIALSSSFLQTGRFYISTKAVIPSLDKLSVMKGLSKIFSFKNLIEFLKAVIKIVVITMTVYLVTYEDLLQIKLVHSFSLSEINHYIIHIVLKVLIAISILVGIIAVLDYFYQRYTFYSQLKMSKYELKQEYKETEGNPEIKAKLRQLRLARAKKRMMAAIPTADVVITNPTHYAVALKYDRAQMNAPTLVAKGLDHIALKIRDIAYKNQVTIIENPPLARALYASTEIDEEIPIEHYKAVAEIISYIYKMKKNKSKS
jgi:flagellar biosynthetic protein FlhB